MRFIRRLVLAGAVAAPHPACSRSIVIDEDAPIPTCADKVLTPEVEELMRPVLVAHRQSGWAPDLTALEALLGSRQPAAAEARVALMAYYIGEHAGEELLESVLQERLVTGPLVARYRQCRPSLASEAEIGHVRVLRTLYDHFAEGVAKGPAIDQFQRTGEAC